MKRVLLPLLLILASCSNPQPGPDKTATGTVLGAGWGAGAGAIIGHQLSYAGEGAAIGAGFGLVNGAMNGFGFDSIENVQLEHEKQLASLKLQNQHNGEQLAGLQRKLDDAIASDAHVGISHLYFDPDSSNLRAGSMSNLEAIANNLLARVQGYNVHVVGHADDSGTPDYNQRLSEARARTVSAYLAQKGVALDQMKVQSKGSQQPLASNSTETGRQLNRRVDIYLSK